MKAVVKMLNARSMQGKCPRWHQQSGSLYWLDVAEQSLNVWQTGHDRTLTLQLPEPVGCFSFCSSNTGSQTNIVAASHHGLVHIESLQSGRTFSLQLSDNLLPDNPVIEGRCDAAGRFWLGCTSPNLSKPEAWIYSLGAALRLERKAGPLMSASCIAFSPDFSTIYYADAPEHVIYACEYDLEEGTLNNRRVFHRFPFGKGMPGGAAVDSEGGVWVAMFAGAKVMRLSPGGLVIEDVPLPVKYPTTITFGGEDNTTLFITSSRKACSGEEQENYPDSGAIFALEAGISGMTEYTFAT